MLKEFKDFIMKGNVLDLAVAVIIAGAFGAVVSSFTNDVIMPIVGYWLGGVDFTEFAWTLKPAVMADGKVVEEAVKVFYGKFIQYIIDFIIIAFVVFMIIRTYNNSQKKKEEAPAAPPAPSKEEVLLTEIRDLLKK